MAYQQNLADEEENTNLNGTAEETLATARDAANGAKAEAMQPAATVPEPLTAPQKPTYSEEEMQSKFTGSPDYSKEEIDAMSPEQYARYEAIGKKHYEENPTPEMLKEKRAAAQKALSDRLALTDDLEKKASVIVDRTAGDNDLKDVHDDMSVALKYLRDNKLKVTKLSDDTLAFIKNDIEQKYDETTKRIGHAEHMWNQLKKGYLSCGNMIYQGMKMTTPGSLDEEDRDLIRGSVQYGKDLEIENPQKVGGFENINSAGDFIDYLSETVVQNVPRAGVSMGLATAGATVMPFAPVAGAMVFGSLGTMWMNTGEAVGDIMDEKRGGDDDIRNSRGYALLQGAGYSVLDGAFGVSAWGAKLWGSMLRKAGMNAVKDAAEGAGLEYVKDTFGKATLKGIGKDMLLHGVLGEGVQEAAQSQLVGRGVRALQTGSLFKLKEDGTYETPKEAWWEAANEFVGGAASGLTFGLVGGAGAHIDAKRSMDAHVNRIMDVVKDDKSFQQLDDYTKLLVSKHLENDGFLATTHYLDPKYMRALEKCNEDIEGEIDRLSKLPGARNAASRMSGQSARLYLDIFKSQYDLTDIGSLIANRNTETGKWTCSDGSEFTPNIDIDGMRQNYEETVGEHVDEKTGEKKKVRMRVFKNPVKGSEMKVAQTLDDDGNPTGRYIFDNDPNWKTPVFGKNELVCDNLGAALEKACDLDVFNQWRKKRMEAKAKTANEVFNKLFGKRGFTLKLVDRPTASGNANATTIADVNAETRTVELSLDKIDNLGKLYTTLMHERSHADIVDFLLGSEKWSKKVGMMDEFDWAEFNKDREALFAKVEDEDGMSAEKMSAQFRTKGSKLNEKTGHYSNTENEWGKSAGIAGEEMVAERGSVRKLATEVRKANRGTVGAVSDKVYGLALKLLNKADATPGSTLDVVRQTIAQKMALDMGVSPMAIMQNVGDNVRAEMQKIFDTGYMGVEAKGFSRENAELETEGDFKARDFGETTPMVNPEKDEITVGTVNTKDDGGPMNPTAEKASAMLSANLKPQMRNGEGASHAEGSYIRRADGTTFIRKGELWNSVDTNENVDDETATNGGYIDFTKPESPVEEKVPAETAPAAEEAAVTEPEKAVSEPEKAEASPESEPVKSEKAEKAENKPVEAAEEAKADKETPETAKVSGGVSEAPATKAKKEKPKKAKKALVKEAVAEPVKANPDETVTVEQNKDQPKSVPVSEEKKTKPAEAEKKEETKEPVAAKEDTVSVAQEREKAEKAEDAKPEAKDGDQPVQAKDDDTVKVSQADKAMDDAFDAVFPFLGEGQRATIKALAGSYGEPKDIIESPIHKGFVKIVFDGRTEFVNPEGNVMTTEELLAVAKSGNGTSGDLSKRSSTILSMPQLSKGKISLGNVLMENLGGIPSNYNGLSDDKLLALAARKDDYIAYVKLWDKWSGKLRKWFADKYDEIGEKHTEKDIDGWVEKARKEMAGDIRADKNGKGHIWLSDKLEARRAEAEDALSRVKKMERGMSEEEVRMARAIEEMVKSGNYIGGRSGLAGTPLSRLVNAETFFYSIANGLWEGKLVRDYLAKVDAEYAERKRKSEAAEIEKAKEAERLKKLRMAEMEHVAAGEAFMSGRPFDEVLKEMQIAEYQGFPDWYRNLSVAELGRRTATDSIARNAMTVRIGEVLFAPYRPKDDPQGKKADKFEKDIKDEEGEETAGDEDDDFEKKQISDDKTYSSLLAYKLRQYGLGDSLAEDVYDYVIANVNRQWEKDAAVKGDEKPSAWQGGLKTEDDLKNYLTAFVTRRIKQILTKNEKTTGAASGAISYEQATAEAGSKVDASAMSQMEEADPVEASDFSSDIGTEFGSEFGFDSVSEGIDKDIYGKPIKAVNYIIESGILSPGQGKVLKSLVNAWTDFISSAYVRLQEAKARHAHGKEINRLEEELREAQGLEFDEDAVESKAAAKAKMKRHVYRSRLGQLMRDIGAAFSKHAKEWKYEDGRTMSRKDFLRNLSHGRFSSSHVDIYLAGMKEELELGYNAPTLMADMEFNGDSAMRLCVALAEQGKTDWQIEKHIAGIKFDTLANADGSKTVVTLLRHAYENYGWIDKRLGGKKSLNELVGKIMNLNDGLHFLGDEIEFVERWMKVNGMNPESHDVNGAVLDVLRSGIRSVPKKRASGSTSADAVSPSQTDHDKVAKVMDENDVGVSGARGILKKSGISEKRIDKMIKNYEKAERKAAEKAAKVTKAAPESPKTNDDVASSLPLFAKRKLIREEAAKEGEEYQTDAQVVAFAKSLGLSDSEAEMELRNIRPAVAEMTEAEMSERSASIAEEKGDVRRLNEKELAGLHAANEQEREKVRKESAEREKRKASNAERVQRDADIVQKVIDKVGKANTRVELERMLSDKAVSPELGKALESSGFGKDEAIDKSKVGNRVEEMLGNWIKTYGGKDGGKESSRGKTISDRINEEAAKIGEDIRYKSDVSIDQQRGKFRPVDDTSAFFPSRAGIKAHGRWDEMKMGHVRKRDLITNRVAEYIRSDREKFDRIVADADNFQPIQDEQLRAITLEIGNRMADAIDGHLDGEEFEKNEEKLKVLVRAAFRAASQAGRTLRMAQLGFDLRTRDSIAYMTEQVRAQFEKEDEKRYGSAANDSEIVKARDAKIAELQSRLSEMAAEMAKQHDIIEKNQKAIDEKVRAAEDRSLKKGIEEGRRIGREESDKLRDENIRILSKKYAGKVDAGKIGQLADALSFGGRLFNVNVRHAGNPADILTDDHRAFFRSVADAFGNDYAAVRESLSNEGFGEHLSLFDKFVEEERRDSNDTGLSDNAKKKKAEKRRAKVKDSIEKTAPKATRGTIEAKLKNRLANADILARDAADDETALSAIGEAARTFAKLFVIKKTRENTEVSIDDVVKETQKYMNGIVERFDDFDYEDARDAMLGKGDFALLNKNKAQVSLEKFLKAKKVAESANGDHAKILEAARMVGMKVESDADIVQELDFRIGKALNQRLDVLESRINEGEEANAELRGQIKDLIAALHDIRSGTKTADELLNRYFNLAEGMKDYRRQKSVLDRINSHIAMYERKIAGQDFEPAPKRENPDDENERREIQHALRNLERMRERFKKERNMWRIRKEPFLNRQWSSMLEILGEIKALAGSMDLSSVLRQGGQLTWAHSLLAAKNIKKTLAMFTSEDKCVEAMNSIWDRPNAKYYQKAGIDFTDWGTNAANSEDLFLLNQYRRFTKMKLLRMGVESSERAFSMFLNLMRADVFDAMIANSPARVASAYTDEQLKTIGNYINIASQRGVIDKSGALGKSLQAANAVLWSPRNLISRMQFLWNTATLLLPGAKTYGTTDWAMRKMFAKETARYFTGVAAAIFFTKMMADLLRGDDEPPEDLVLDPRSSDFLCVKIGNTHLDFLSGLKQFFTFTSRMVTGETRTSRGQVMKANRAEQMGKFLRSKFSPASSVIYDVVSQETYDKQDIKWGSPFAYSKDEIGIANYVFSQTLPLSLADITEQFVENGPMKSAITTVFAMLGAGANTYDPYTYKQLKGDYHYFRKLMSEADTQAERDEIVRKHPMMRNAGSIEAHIKWVNSIERDIKKIEQAGGNSDNLKDLLERARKQAINLMTGAKHPMDVQ